MTAIHQFLPSFAFRDAIGGHTRQVQRLLRELGYESDVYAADIHPGADARPYESFRADTTQDTWLLYQHSTGSPVADFLRDRSEPLLIDYHNITPAPLFEPWEPSVGPALAAGRRQLAELAVRSEGAIADSAFNARECDAIGYRRTAVVPILIDLDQFAAADEAADAEATRIADTLRSARNGGAGWLFVGRIVPNKAQHDVLKAFAVYRQVYDPKATLTFVGGSSSHAYLTAIQRTVEALGLQQCVTLAGSVGDAEFVAHYRAADVFVCLSDHEGFCVPILEAFHHGVPIVGLAAAAVPETCGGAALMLPAKEPGRVAAAVARVMEDGALRQRLREAGKERLQDFSLTNTRKALTETITEWVGPPA